MSIHYNIKQTRIITTLCFLSVIVGLMILTNTKFIHLVFYLADSILSKNLNQSFWLHGINSAAIDLIIAGVAMSLYYFYPSISMGKTFFTMSIAFVVHFYYEVIGNSVNIPMSDDFESAMAFINKLFLSNNFHEKLLLLS